MATPNYDIDYNDKRLVEVTTNRDEALKDNEKIYDDAINGVDGEYDKLIAANADAAEERKKQQQARTDFTIEQIEQQKEQTKKDYIREQSGAYVDWQREKDSYGAGAEQRAAAGLAGAGYSESAQVSIYNTYQNRVATARDAYGRAVLNYDNAIKDARLQNDSILAEIALTSLQQQLELSLEGFKYKNQLLIEKANKKLDIQNAFHSQYMNVLAQINAENRLKEDVRQHNENLAEQRRQAQAAAAARAAELAWEKEKWHLENDPVVVSSNKPNAFTNDSRRVGKTEYKKKGGTLPEYTTKNYNGSSPSSGFTGSTYKDANSYLKKNGVSDYNLMTESEWKRRKSSYKRTGIGGYEVSANSSYKDYLKTATAYAIKNK